MHKKLTRAQHAKRLRRWKQLIEQRLQPGDRVTRTPGRLDTFLGLVELQDMRFYTEGWRAQFEVPRASGGTYKTLEKMTSLLFKLGFTAEEIYAG